MAKNTSSDTNKFQKILNEVKSAIKKKQLEEAASKYAELKSEYSSLIASDLNAKKKKEMYVKTAKLYQEIMKLKEKHDKISKKSDSKDYALLSEAVSDLDKQYTRISSERKKLESDLMSISRSMAQVQNEERKLRDQISQFVDKEAVINSKRLATAEQLNKAKQKMAEILKIKEELRGL